MGGQVAGGSSAPEASAAAGGEEGPAVWGEGKLTARPQSQPCDEVPKIELADIEVPYEESLARMRPSTWNAMQGSRRCLLRRVLRSEKPVGEFDLEWAQERSWNLMLVAVTWTGRDGKLQPGEYQDGWRVELLDERTRLRFYDAARGEPSQEGLLSHRERRWSDEIRLRWPSGIERVHIVAAGPDGASWRATVKLPTEPLEGWASAFVVLRSGEDPDAAGGDGGTSSVSAA